ncbi:hypothetical protein P8C59_009058 [Phyllachora maydis]|uniref:DUF8021 domain-containing protein n=1 Tax=Phyllachora maydis TaxID=1825666 RepID=A0AAD9IBV0_9PEZI|nr:hypothetical protein P8C59_009058 [Phyllachora maydis]
MVDVFYLALALLASTRHTLAACTRESLLAAAQSYISAQAQGTSAGLSLAGGGAFVYRENNKVADIQHGLLATPLTITLNRSTADTVACASYTMLVSSAGPKPYVLATQIRHGTGDAANITMIDTIATTTGSLFFDAGHTAQWVRAENWTTIADVARRPSRDLLQKWGDTYLDMWTDAQAQGELSWAADCERVEGGRLAKPCTEGLPTGQQSAAVQGNGMRRYVIDETVGSVNILCEFTTLGNTPDSHEIRIIDGQIKYVQTVTL